MISAWGIEVEQIVSDQYSLRIVASEEEASAREGPTVVVPTLQFPEKTTPLVQTLNSLTREAECISVWRPLRAFWRLHRLRRRFNVERDEASRTLEHCYARLREPVEGATTIDSGWIQSLSMAIGTSALFQLQSALQHAGEVFDRKSAYSLAFLSLYIAITTSVLTPFLEPIYTAASEAMSSLTCSVPL
jgi:hypothetical protein